MKWLGRLLPILLLVALLMSATAILADEGGESNNDEDSEGGGLDVGIVIVGDEPDVDIAIVGDDPDIALDVGGDNPAIYLDGRDINQPIVIRIKSSSGISKTKLRDYVKQALAPVHIFIDEAAYRIDLTSEGLAKLITVVETTNSSNATSLEEIQGELDELEKVLEREKTSRECNLEVVRTDMQYQISSLRYQVDYLEYQQTVWLIWLSVSCAIAVFGLALALGLLLRKVNRLR